MIMKVLNSLLDDKWTNWVLLGEYGIRGGLLQMKAGQRDIFYLSAPSRQLAESSPYYESLRYSTLLLPVVVGSGSPLDLDPVAGGSQPRFQIF